MGDSYKSEANIERNQSTLDSSSTTSLVGDMMVCRTAHEIFTASCAAFDQSYLPNADILLSQLAENQQEKVCKAPTHEQYGPTDTSRDEYGEMVEVKEQTGNTFTKNSDGTWTHQINIPGHEPIREPVDNVTVDTAGNVSYDMELQQGLTHITEGADQTYTVILNGETFVYDKNRNLAEAPSGDGRTRKFHYDENGKLDQIEGNLGHWDRTVTDGKTYWTNKETGTVWQGDFTINGNDRSLEYRGQNGVMWDFTTTGKDVRMPNQK